MYLPHSKRNQRCLPDVCQSMFPLIVRDRWIKAFNMFSKHRTINFCSTGCFTPSVHTKFDAVQHSWLQTILQSCIIVLLEPKCCQEKGFADGFRSIRAIQEGKVAVFSSRVCSCFPTNQFSFCYMQHKAATLIMWHRPKFTVYLSSPFFCNFCNALFLHEMLHPGTTQCFFCWDAVCSMHSHFRFLFLLPTMLLAGIANSAVSMECEVPGVTSKRNRILSLVTRKVGSSRSWSQTENISFGLLLLHAAWSNTNILQQLCQRTFASPRKTANCVGVSNVWTVLIILSHVSIDSSILAARNRQLLATT